MSRPGTLRALSGACLLLAVLCGGCKATGSATAAGYPLHTGIVATTFWVGEIFDLNAADGSQVTSAYDGQWMTHFGGCDGKVVDGACETEPRTAANGYFPTAMTPRENPFYLDVPYDDIGDPSAFAQRGTVVPWAGQSPYAGHATDHTISFLKNRWVRLTKGDRVCYGQIEDAGPGQYDDTGYVFGTAHPANHRYGGAGTDVSPALNGCLGFADLNGDTDRIDWQFVEFSAVPSGPWTKIVTTSGVTPNS